ATDPAVYGFETDTQGWESNGEPIVTLTKSSEQHFAGDSSLSVAFNAAGFASVEVADTGVLPGQKITLHLYLPAASGIEWIQTFAKGGSDGAWEWHGNWIPVEGLELGAWNTVTVEIPADAQPLYGLGLELYAPQPNAGTVYLDSVDYSFPPDTGYYTFEASTDGWESFRDPIVQLSTSTAHRFAGNKSLALAIDGAGLAAVGTMTPAVQAGDTVTFHIYVSADANIDWIQPFAIEGEAGNWAWHGNWQPIENLQLGAWNTLTLTVPENATPLDAIGLEVSAPESYTGTIYIDSVSVE
ncbi:MAG TPA: hypothetical protein VK629_14665, partial [Steroidobacteraceae bacterium]|nr:hypothetical protein [Steroidobacteraceae bacterium]